MVLRGAGAAEVEPFTVPTAASGPFSRASCAVQLWALLGHDQNHFTIRTRRLPQPYNGSEPFGAPSASTRTITVRGARSGGPIDVRTQSWRRMERPTVPRVDLLAHTSMYFATLLDRPCQRAALRRVEMGCCETGPTAWRKPSRPIISTWRQGSPPWRLGWRCLYTAARPRCARRKSSGSAALGRLEPTSAGLIAHSATLLIKRFGTEEEKRLYEAKPIVDPAAVRGRGKDASCDGLAAPGHFFGRRRFHFIGPRPPR